MEVKVLNINGKETGRKVQLSDSVFAIEPNKHAVYLDVKQYLANQRQGTHKAKERAEVAGSTRKIKKQKGTGTARAGSAKNPLFKGGGRVFGPRPRSYSFKLNKTVKRLARRSAFSIKAQEANIIVVEDFVFEAPNTKNFINVLKALGLEDKKSLFVLGDSNKNVYLSSRNLKATNVLTNSELSTYAILNANNLVLLEGSLEGIEENLSK
ncbi:50S ribosomal protein L4 [Flavobacterium psychrophilum]|uniref:Large ribosomal subunit protein uL4 n=2 Tax=Flavobacterium psychrophilum TaxID=96345 RepID=RL4_FLAPJ|nr:50S ribosomal protein L4 [Flavobacterium psychrophilum]A6GZ98.1 RecName: Full=Large ribosomal subunit protein uL4; AltName: Full=50S ribosomal protein L4 [Flavobacterium psychrophilum JIP02/86]AIG30127.1 50S ribosomal protein L4 [Flavobacterium psychrophilum]AIG32402.1 50S ribosomal protein L4 [Flavobacterium psychrophilum]AIG34561.1 50S ribosomal protein L4 [Flavobacterium psychrophilum]AIG36921.1 50S ribosomal protein L4 [Flavobacterium psychrophilum]AIG39185.1 50S ribosomal protein L4 [